MLIVTGANGKLGRLVVEALLQRVPASRLGVSVRDPAKAGDLEARGVRVRRGDFGDAASLVAAFEGASQVLVVSTGNAVQHGAAIDAAKAAGAARIVYTSHVGASPTSPFAPMPQHAATEVALQATGLPFTALRNGFYAATVPMLLGAALQTGELTAPEDGPVSWTAHADLAEATAILMSEDHAETATLDLTASDAIDLHAIAAMVSELTGRALRRVVVSDAEYHAGMVAKGIPEARADMMIGLFAASRRGQFARVDPKLGQILGRAPTTLREVLRATVASRS